MADIDIAFYNSYFCFELITQFGPYGFTQIFTGMITIRLF